MFIADPSRKPTDIFLYTLHPTRPAMLTEGATDGEKAMRSGGGHRSAGEDDDPASQE